MNLSLLKTAICFSVAASFGIGASCVQAEPFYTDSDKPGYWWYKDPKEEEKKEQEQKEPKEPVVEQKVKEPEVAAPKHRLPKMADYTYEQLWNMHPQDFKQLLDDFRDKAIMTLSPEDIKEHKIVQDLARRKSVAFMNVNMAITRQNPELSLEKDIPNYTPAQAAYERTNMADIKSKLAANRDQFGLVYFQSPECQYCTKQSEVLGYFTKTSKWNVKSVDISENPSVAETFGVTITPTIILVRKGDPQHLLVSSGYVTMDDIETRVYSGIQMLAGESTIQQYGLKDHQKGGGLDPTAILEKSKKSTKKKR